MNIKYLLTTSAISAGLLLSACGNLIPLHKAGTITNDDLHSQTTLLIGGDAGDPQGCNQAIAMGSEHTHYVWSGGQWAWTTDPVQMRPVEAPALGCTLVPPLIEAGGSLGAGALIRGGEIGAAEIGGYANYAAAGVQAKALVKGDTAIGQGIASAHPPVISNTNLNVNGNYATGGAGGAGGAGGSASATATAIQQQQQQQQQFQTAPYTQIVIRPPS